MRSVIMAVISIVMMAQTVSAEVYIAGGSPEANSPVKQGEYSGPEITLLEVAGLGLAMAMAQTIRPEALGPGAAALGVIAWGAYRTDKYRPENVKVAVAMGIAANEAKAKAGTVAEVLGY